ncbi:MAG: glycoside hydrolase family 15 protein [Spirochaetales bacterium]|nr:glycoside hydrolase family 15 protein [Spirochaetales bacterium]
MNNLDYGIIGNCQSAALISKNGSMDWCCLPSFDSSSVFAKLLDTEKGGSFEFIVEASYWTRQFYIDKTNILVTSFSNGIDCFEVVDFMPRYQNSDHHYYFPPDLVRHIKLKSGSPKFRIKYNPRLEYAKYETKSIIEKNYIKSYTTRGSYDSVYLYTNLDRQKILDSEEIQLTENSFFLLSYNQKILAQTVERSYLKLQRTKVYWLNWSERTVKYKKYNEAIMRSALVLKLLSYQKTGAIIAAATTSLPESLGEIRNWDYRFCWIRDASMVVRVMTHLGHFNMAKRYINFVIDIIPEKDEKIQIMYGINREKELSETELDYLAGYENSKPVRIGNAAFKQKQNDIYGVLMDALYHQFRIFENTMQNSEDLWTITRSIVKTVAANWMKPDKGIWEIRSENKHFTFSKVLCWTAVDRAIKIAQLINMKEYIPAWTALKDKIKEDVYEKAWNDDIQAFTQSYGSKEMDAANLLMEYYGFIKADDPKYKSTVLQIKKDLCYNGLMYRYKNPDDFGQPASSFIICTFWLIDSLRKIGEKDEAERLFEGILNHRNHVGLLSEDMDFETKRLLGNFPQAYSHLALIEAAIILSDNAVTREEEILEVIHHN